MALVVTHAFVATGSETAGAHAAGKAVTSDWNANHVVTGSAVSLADLAALGMPYPVVVDVNTNQIANMGSSPMIDVVPSPGPGKAIKYLGGASLVVHGSIPFNSGLFVNIIYTGDSTAINSNLIGLSALAEDFLPNNAQPELDLVRDTVEDVGLSFGGGSDDPSGAIASAAIADGGSGWAPLDTFVVFAGGFANGIGRVDTVGALGVATGITITVPGAGYIVDTGVTCNAESPSTGIGLTVDINSITPANGSARVWLLVQQLTLP